MQIYISKNNQQLGPFEEAKVLEMLGNKVNCYRMIRLSGKALQNGKNYTDIFRIR